MIKKTVPASAPKAEASVEGRIMHRDPGLEAILLTIKPGEEIPMHKNPFDVLFTGITGKATLVSPAGSFNIQPGETIFITTDEDRAWRNDESIPARIMVFKILK